MRTRMIAGIVGFVLAVGVAPARADVVLFQDGFERDTVANSVQQLLGWDVTGNVDVVAAGDKCGQAGSTTRCIDIDGTGSLVPPVITARAPLTLYPGQYELSFDLAGSRSGDGANSVTVALGTLYQNSFTKGDSEPFTRITVPIAVAAKTVAAVSFAHVGAVDNRGLLLDNVELRFLQGNPAVPAGGFDGGALNCQQAIGRATLALLQRVVNRFTSCLNKEARDEVCDGARLDAAVTIEERRARRVLDSYCTEVEYTALGHVGPAELTRERIVIMALDSAIALIDAGYVAGYGNLP